MSTVGLARTSWSALPSKSRVKRDRPLHEAEWLLAACLEFPSRALHVTWRLMIASAECASAIGERVIASMAGLAINHGDRRIARPQQISMSRRK